MDDWMSAKQVAKMYGVDPATVYRWCQTGALVAYRIGKRYRIKRSDAQAALARVEPTRLPPPEVRRRQDIEEVVEGLRRAGYDVT